MLILARTWGSVTVDYCRRLWQPGIVGYLYRPYGLQCALVSRLGSFDIIGVREQCLNITPIAHRENLDYEHTSDPSAALSNFNSDDSMERASGLEANIIEREG